MTNPLSTNPNYLISSNALTPPTATQTSTSDTAASSVQTSKFMQLLAEQWALSMLSDLSEPGQSDGTPSSMDMNGVMNGLTSGSMNGGPASLSSQAFLSMWSALAQQTSGVSGSSGAVPATADAASSTDTAAIDGAIHAASLKYQIPESVIRSVIQHESAMDVNAQSPAGAIGLMQLMPETAQALGVNPWNPVENIDGGTRYLAEMLQQFGGNMKLALAAYNAGPGAVLSHGGIPPYPETQAYVQNVLSGAGL